MCKRGILHVKIENVARYVGWLLIQDTHTSLQLNSMVTCVCVQADTPQTLPSRQSLSGVMQERRHHDYKSLYFSIDTRSITLVLSSKLQLLPVPTRLQRHNESKPWYKDIIVLQIVE
jgi:hypothetical protein